MVLELYNGECLRIRGDGDEKSTERVRTTSSLYQRRDVIRCRMEYDFWYYWYFLFQTIDRYNDVEATKAMIWTLVAEPGSFYILLRVSTCLRLPTL